MYMLILMTFKSIEIELSYMEQYNYDITNTICKVFILTFIIYDISLYGPSLYIVLKLF